jgi:murein DD-endopeptidase MepM/ murein hydrolase activator NlpD
MAVRSFLSAVGRRPRRVVAVAVALLVAGLVGCPYGVQDSERYPRRESSPYVLPWKAGVAHLCVQGNNGVVSHFGRDGFAWDFYMGTGTDVLAARGGVVIAVKEDSERIASGDAKDNNYVRVRHSDGSVASYLHLAYDGVVVEVGRTVVQRQVLGRSSWTGKSMMPHLHFHVRSAAGKLIPISFKDVDSDRGIPRMFKVYRAGAVK